MAHVSQQRKSELAPAIKAAFARYGMKGSIAVRHHSTLVINVKEGPIDFNASRTGRWAEGFVYNGHLDVNVYHYRDHYTGDALAFLDEVITAANRGNHDRSDLMTDYFDVGWYVDVNIGRWNQPYICTAEKVAA